MEVDKGGRVFLDLSASHATKIQQKQLNQVTKLGPWEKISDLRISKELKVFKNDPSLVFRLALLNIQKILSSVVMYSICRNSIQFAERSLLPVALLRRGTIL